MRAVGLSVGLFFSALPAQAALVDITQTDLDLAITNWVATGNIDYSYVVEYSCFCTLEFLEPRIVKVRDGNVSEVLYQSTMLPDTDFSSDVFGPMFNFFDILQTGLDDGYFEVEAMFYPNTGVPLTL